MAALLPPGPHATSGWPHATDGRLMPQLRRSYGKVSTRATGVLYLLCFRERLGTERHSIKHYIGFARDLDARLERHRAGQGAKITQALLDRGIEWDVAAVWPGNRGVENELKLHSATRICPRCTPGAQPPRVVQEVIKAEARRLAREARKTARQIRETQRHAAEVAKRAAMSPYERGADMAKRWIYQQAQAGRTAEQLAATDAYVTGPLRDRARSDEKAQEVARGWAEVIARELARLGDKQAAAARQAEAQAGQLKSEAGAFPGRDPGPAEAVPADEEATRLESDDDHAWEPGADGYPEPDDWASYELPAEQDPGAGDLPRSRPQASPSARWPAGPSAAP